MLAADHLFSYSLPLCALAMVCGCATGTPAGARVELALREPQPYSPPASPVQVEDVQDSQPTTAVTSLSPPLEPGVDSQRSRIVDFARESLGRKRIETGGHRYQDDCTGLVLAAYSQVGIPLLSQAKAEDNGVAAIYRYVKSRGRVFRSENPTPGDLVFFRETYDLNRDGRANDGLTHVGIVEAVDDASTVTIIHRVNRGVVRYRMNLARPTLHRESNTGDVLNDYLRSPGQNHPLALTGQLFASYGSLFPPSSAGPEKTKDSSGSRVAAPLRAS